MASPISTYSIVACDLDAGQWGVAVQSKFLAVGSVVPWAEPHVGAVATQAYANPRYGPEGLALLRDGLSAEETVERLTEADDGRDAPAARRRRRARAAARPSPAPSCHDWAGGRTGDGYAAQGNILVSGDTVDALAETFEATRGPLAERLIDASPPRRRRAATSRGQQSASLLVVERDGGYAGLSDVVVDLRVDDHETPIEELRRLYAIHDQLFGKTPRDRVARRGRRARRRAARAARGARLRGELDALFAGRQREPRGARRRRRRDRPGRARRAEEERMSGYEVGGLTGVEALNGPGSAALDAAAQAFGITAFGDQRLYGDGGGPGRRRGAHRGAARARGDVRRRLRPRDIHARRRGDRRACRHGRLPPRPDGEALSRARRSPGRRCSRSAASRAQHEVSAWEWIFAAYPKADAGDYEGAIAELEAGLARSPSIRRLLYHRACILARAGRLDEARAVTWTGRSSSTPSCGSGPTRTRTWPRYASPGSRSPAARSRKAGTGSASGRATRSTAP